MNQSKNILLVYPEIPNNTYWSFKYALRFIRKKSTMPPLGLITLAALIPDNYKLKLVDMNIETLDEKDVQEADYVFISAMIVQKDSMARVVEICNRMKTPVIAGGPYPTSSHEEIQGVDHFVLGEVEDVFHEILMEIESGNAAAAYRISKRPDITNSVIPRFDLLDMNAYGTMSVQYSRGCPFKCEFCDIWKVYGNKPRLKGHLQLISELDTLYGLGWRGALFIVDDNFIGNKKRVKKELLPALKNWQEKHKYPFTLFTEVSINIAEDKNLLSGMKQAGFTEVFVGIETPDANALKETGKKQNLRTDMKEAVKTIQTHGIEVMAGFIIGFDSDTNDIFDRQIDFIQQAGIPQAMVGILMALPGTDLYNRLESEGRILFHSDGNNTHNLTANFITKMNEETLKQGYEKILSSIYDSNLKNYFTRCNRLMDRLGDVTHFQRKIGLSEMLMLFKSLVYQPFTSYGYQYLKFVSQNLFRHFNIFGEVIRYAIIGHHFHTITQETLKIERVSSNLDAEYSKMRDQISQYSTTVVDNSVEGIEGIVNLWEKRKKILTALNRQIKKIHVDFRNEISIKYAETAEKMNSLFTSFEDRPAKSGRTLRISSYHRPTNRPFR
ncbi:MAG: B12-binding domain-containing radical SAM protein [Desulfobacterales bacterium]